MTTGPIRLLTPAGKPFWLIYGVRCTSNDDWVYIGRTKMPLWARWSMHGLSAYHGRKGHTTPFLSAIRAAGSFAFQPEELACCLSERDAAWTENYLITKYNTLHPSGLNSAPAIKGGKRSADFDARHRAAIRAGYASMTPAQRKNFAAQCAANGGRVRLRWSDPNYRAAHLPQVKEAAAKAAIATRGAWADPAQRPARAANLKAAREARVFRKTGSRVKDARQTKLL